MSLENRGSREASPPEKTTTVKQASGVHVSQTNRERRVAKIGMGAAMGALVLTGLMRGRGAKVLHIWSGIALVGLSCWHHRLYSRS